MATATGCVAMLAEVMTLVRGGDFDPRAAAVLGQLAATQLRAIEVTHLAAEIERLKAALGLAA